jgi:hypothetical protein
VEEGLALLGDHERVPFRQGADIEECEDVLVLVHAVAGDLAVQDLAEYGGLGHGRIVFCRPCPA